jgi:hypothetical protein
MSYSGNSIPNSTHSLSDAYEQLLESAKNVISLEKVFILWEPNRVRATANSKTFSNYTT